MHNAVAMKRALERARDDPDVATVVLHDWGELEVCVRFPLLNDARILIRIAHRSATIGRVEDRFGSTIDLVHPNVMDEGAVCIDTHADPWVMLCAVRQMLIAPAFDDSVVPGLSPEEYFAQFGASAEMDGPDEGVRAEAMGLGGESDSGDSSDDSSDDGSMAWLESETEEAEGAPPAGWSFFGWIGRVFGALFG